MLGRPFEQHVLQKMSHAGFAVTFVARTNEYGHVDGNTGGRLVGHHQDTTTVGQSVFGDSFHLRDFFNFGLCRCE